jgi:uncharacterized protein YhaN
MRLRQLRLNAFGPFTDTLLDFDPAHGNLFLVHGRNEAGKSSTLRAMVDLRYGFQPQSPDDFVHTYADLAIGAVMVDAQGRSHSLLRRKKRDNSLGLHDFDGPLDQPFRPVTPDIEALLTGGLRREDFLNLFGLDHARLRSGGQALASGEGDLGAALFEASAGIKSIPALLAALDAQARQHYISRGKNARINLALADYADHHDRQKQLLVRPGAWADLQRQHAQARAELTRIRAELKARRERQLLIGELRAVAPLLADLQAARQALQALAGTPLLSADSAERRVSAETRLSEAQAGAASARARLAQLDQQLAALQLDSACLAVAPAIARLDAAQEQIDAAARDLRNAEADEQSAMLQLAEAALAIDPHRSATDLLARAPSPAQAAELNALLDRIDGLRHQLQLQQEALAALPPLADATLPAPPHPQVVLALRAALQAAARLAGMVAREAALPLEIAAAQRQRDALLAELGLSVDGLAQARPLLDDDIDTALAATGDALARQQRLADDLARHRRQLAADLEARAALLAQGGVPTPADVTAARRHRDAGWALVRRIHIEQQPDGDALRAWAGQQPLHTAYEAAVQAADQSVDALGRDAGRAAQLQAVQQRIDAAEAALQALQDEQAAHTAQSEARQAQWTVRLQTAGLPALAPPALRQWQARLMQAWQAAEAVPALHDEWQQATAQIAAMAITLADAIAATGLSTPLPGASLAALEALAGEVERQIQQRQQAIDASAAAMAERSRHRTDAEARQGQARQALAEARAALSPLLQPLLLSDSDAAAARARLAAFAALQAARRALDSARLQCGRHRDTLAAHATQAAAVAEALHQPAPEPASLRLFIDSLAQRREQALAGQAQRQKLEDQRSHAQHQQQAHEEAIRTQQAVLASLCAAAGVDDAVALPEAELRSAQRRFAEDRRADLERQLASASRRPLPALAERLAQEDVTALPAEEDACIEAIAALERSERSAAQAEEEARRALDAVDAGDGAAAAREGMELAAAAVRAGIGPWIRARLAHSLLQEATSRFRERAQGPMLRAASGYFAQITGAEFSALQSDESGSQPVLRAQRADSRKVAIEGLSEGTRDQLYLALRLAALELRRQGGADLPVTLDDVLMTSDDTRAAQVLQALQRFAAGGTQVIVFTHHQHLVEVARRACDGAVGVIQLG